MARVLVIGDTHEPYTHPGYLAFCQDLAEEWAIDKVVHIGDVTDWHSVSFHLKRPEMPGPAEEYARARVAVARWYERFPVAQVCIGNHDERVYRLGRTVGIPDELIRTYEDIWDTPTWDWEDQHVIDGVVYRHGTGVSGVHPAYNAALKMCCSVVIGHTHAAGGVKFIVGPMTRHFGMDVGCGVDDRALAFAYAGNSLRKSVLSAGIVLDGCPYYEPMPIGRGERYHRSRFSRRKRRS